MLWKAHVRATQSPQKKATADLPALWQLLPGMDVGTQFYPRPEHMHTYGCAARPTADSQITWDYSISYFRKIKEGRTQDQNTRDRLDIYSEW